MNRRTVLLELLISSGVYSIRESSNAKEFAAGTRKLTLRELDIDSLSAMEICIQLENRFQLSIAPETLLSFEYLDDLLAAIPIDHTEDL
jgi:acyl carrier protein